METNDTAIGQIARLRDFVPINQGAGVSTVRVLSSYVLPGVDWDYYQAFYRNLGLAKNWPDGLSVHASWESNEGWRSIYLWDENLTADHYFASAGMKAVTDTVGERGPAQSGAGATDVEPLRLDVHKWILGLYAGAFSDASEALEAGVSDKLGLRPVIVELDLTSDANTVIGALGFDDRIPRDLMALVVADHPVGSRMLQIWTGEEIARAGLEADVFPAFERAGIDCDADPAESIVELRRLVVARGAAQSFGHPLAIEL